MVDQPARTKAAVQARCDRRLDRTRLASGAAELGPHVGGALSIGLKKKTGVALCESDSGQEKATSQWVPYSTSGVWDKDRHALREFEGRRLIVCVAGSRARDSFTRCARSRRHRPCDLDASLGIGARFY